MNTTTVFITGINGFVGSNLALYLKNNGYIVKGSLSDLSKASSVKKITTDLTQIKLGPDILSQAIPDNIDVLIYAAHDKNTASNNIEGNKLLFKIAEQKGCKYHLFVSSISAHSSNTADYGQVKLELEKFFMQKMNAAVIRPGLVIGDGGLYSNMDNFVQKNYFIPLPDGGKYQMAIIEMQELAKSIECLIQNRSVGLFNLYQPQLISLKEIVKKIASKNHKKTLVINIPSNLILLFFGVFKFMLKLLKINKKINLDSVAGYKLYKTMVLPPSDLKKLSSL